MSYSLKATVYLLGILVTVHRYRTNEIPFLTIPYSDVPLLLRIAFPRRSGHQCIVVVLSTI